MAVMDEIREELEIEQTIANALNWTEYNNRTIGNIKKKFCST